MAVFASSRGLAQQRDPWWGPDKQLHFTYSALITGISYGGLAMTYSDRPVRLLGGGAVAMSAGIGKEVYDLSGHGDPSWRDLTWDALGVATGLGISLLVDLTLTHLFPTNNTTQWR